MNVQTAILKELRRLRAGRIIDDDIAICHEGKPCEHRKIVSFRKRSIIMCSTLIPCRTSTRHNITIHGEF